MEAVQKDGGGLLVAEDCCEGFGFCDLAYDEGSSLLVV